MAEPEESRPKAVTAIGWLWVVLGVLFLLRTLVNMIVWRMLKPDMLGFLETFGGVPPTQQRFLRPLFEHLGALLTSEAILFAAVIVVAMGLLRLRPWARVGMQAICWLLLAAVAAFGAFWVWLCGSVAAAVPSSAASSFGRFGLVAGLAFCLAVAAGLAVMIGLLASTRVREAFRHTPPASR
jgi:hypothetical protein